MHNLDVQDLYCVVDISLNDFNYRTQSFYYPVLNFGNFSIVFSVNYGFMDIIPSCTFNVPHMQHGGGSY